MSRAPARAAALIGLLAVTGGAVAVAGSSDRAAESTPSTDVSGPTTPVRQRAAQLAPRVAGILSADVLGVPADWAIGEIGPEGGGPQGDLGDPFLGLLSCPEGTVREDATRAWIGRRFSAPEVPLENGLLSVEVVVEEEGVADWQHDRDGFSECSTSEQAQLSVESTDLAGSDAVAVELLAEPSASVPYASAFYATAVNVDGHSVTVVLGGIDMAQSWRDLADDIAVLVLDRLNTPTTSTTSMAPSPSSTPAST